MAHKAGRDASFKVGSNTVENVISWSLEITNDPITENTMGSNGWTQTFGVSTTSWTATVDLIYDPTDTNGQMTIYDAVVSGTKLTNLNFYEDATNYYTSNTGLDADAGAYITGFPITTNAGDVARVSINIQGSGPLHRTS